MPNMDLDRMITQWIEENKERVLEDWMRLIRIPSVQEPAEPGAPFGQPCAKALQTAAQLFADRGFDVRVEADDGYALAQMGTGEKLIGMFGHSDVVPAGDDWLYTQPFTPIIRDGAMIGRGCGDNKNGVMAGLCVMSILDKYKLPLRNRLRMFIGSNEESGMADVNAYVKKETMPDLSLVPDARFPVCLGEKSILRSWSRCEMPLSQILEFKGGKAFNVVLDHVEVLLKHTPALEAQLRERIAGEKAYVLSVEPEGLLLRAKGVPKHAGSPDGSVNAAALAAKVLVGCDALHEGDRKIMQTVVDYLESPYGEGMGLAHQDPVFGRLTAVNGMVCVEENHLKVSLDMRFGTTFDHLEAEQKLCEAWQKAGWTVPYVFNRKGYANSPDAPVVKILCDTFQNVTGRPAVPYYMAAGTYSRHLENAYTVGTCILLDGQISNLPMPAGHGGAHQSDEHTNIEGFFRAVRVLTHAVVRLDQQL